MKDKKTSIHNGHRNRVKERFLKNGLSGFSEHEILEFLLFYAKPQGDTNASAHELINEYGSLSKVLDAPVESLEKTKGIGSHTAIFLTLLPKVFKEYQLSKSDSTKPLVTYSDCYTLASNLFINSCVEELYVVCLNNKNAILGTKQISQGNTDHVDVPIRAITNFILKCNCSRILIYHNHPSEIQSFSDDDIALTTSIYNACLLNEIDIVDHILYTHNGCVSMNKTGVLEDIKYNVLNILNITKDTATYKKLYCSSNIIEIKD